MPASRLRRFSALIGSLIGSLIGAAGAIALLLLSPWWVLLAALLLVGVWTLLTRVGRQAWSVTEVGLATIPQRLGASSVVVVGIAGVVAVLVALLAMAAGFEATLKQGGSDDTAIVMRAGAQTEINSVLDHDSANLVAQAPQVLRDAQGQPIASAELVLVASLPKKSSGLDANVELRGFGASAWRLRPNVRIIDGRKFGPGLREMFVGKGARQQFSSLDIGSTLQLHRQNMTRGGAFCSAE